VGVLGPFLKQENGLSVRNGVLCYKQLIRPVMDCSCLMWGSAARNHVRKLQVLLYKCLRIATNAPWYVGNRQIHEDLGFKFFAVHIRALTESLDSMLADAGNPAFRQLGKLLWWPGVNCSRPRVAEDWWSAGVWRPPWKDGQVDARSSAWLLHYS
jgi:hypothetical protein